VTSSSAAVESRPGGEQIYCNLPGVAVVRWDAVSDGAHIEWQGWARPAEFRTANNALVQAMQDHALIG